MKLKYSREEEKELLDKIIEIAMIVHESGAVIASRIGLPQDVLWSLRARSPRAEMIGDCPCSECKVKEGVKK